MLFSNYSFNGKEKDDEVYGDGNSYDFGDRMLDPRLGRWMSVDKMSYQFSAINPYNFALNNPIYLIDLDGNIIFPNDQLTKDAVNARLDKLLSGDLAKYRNQIVYEIIGTVPVKTTDDKGVTKVVNREVYGFVYKGGVPGVTTDLNENTIINSKSLADTKDKLMAIAYLKAIQTNESFSVLDANYKQEEYLNQAIVNNDGGAQDEGDFAAKKSIANFEQLTNAKDNTTNDFKFYPDKENHTLNQTGTGKIPVIVRGVYITSNSSVTNIDNVIADIVVNKTGQGASLTTKNPTDGKKTLHSLSGDKANPVKSKELPLKKK